MNQIQRSLVAFLGSVLALLVGSPAQVGVAQDDQHLAEQAVKQFEVHPELSVELFACEPMLVNPTNLDVDHLGRIWVCEVVNYRQFANGDTPKREAGDRILVLEDTDGDARADRQTVFYQGPEIDSAHGICVLGNRVIVSANDTVLVLEDTDGDLQADHTEVLFRGIGGVQHDHGIHAFVFGPDGKLYFNFGNEGRQILDRDGQPITDRAGHRVAADNQPYNQGMIFRCNLDGTDFETLAWNFRNNWEVAVDSFGSLWQSDNDDDGNRATRINYVMPYGNYGYKDQLTGQHWNAPRTGWHADVPQRHWHQNDPGVVPNLLLTGAGSPTGICIYEGDLLPSVFQGQMIHCDAGPNVVRSYPVTKQGAGYTATVVSMLDGSRQNQWFRPSDVCVAPDGSLIVADWYDAGVGGHRMVDIERGRLFRITTSQHPEYRVQPPDFSTPAAAAKALCSPNQATRYLAWQALHRFGDQALPELERLFGDSNPRFRARALWVAGKLTLPWSTIRRLLEQGLLDSDPDVRCMALRLGCQLISQFESADWRGVLDRAAKDSSAEVRREVLIALRDRPIEGLPDVWSAVAARYLSGDRWMLEALGIAADGHWEACLEAWSQPAPLDLTQAATRDLLWRSRSRRTPEWLARILKLPQTGASETLRYLRAFDYQDPSASSPVLAELAFVDQGFDPAKARLVQYESVSRLALDQLTENQREQLDRLVRQFEGTPEFISLVEKIGPQKYAGDLLTMAGHGEQRQLAADAMRLLIQGQQESLVHEALLGGEADLRANLGEALVNCGQRNACAVLAKIARQEDLDVQRRTEAVNRLGQIQSGVQDLRRWIERNEPLDSVILPAIAAALHASRDPAVRSLAEQRFPLAKSKDDRPLPSMEQLLGRRGDAKRGQQAFESVGTCSKCHVVNRQGIEVGPDLSEIGNKLTRQAMYESILFPSAGISHNYENWLVLTDDGQLTSGILLGKTDVELSIKDDKGIVHRFELARVEELKRQAASLMPEGLHQQMSEQDLVDLVEYMVALKRNETGQ